MASLASLGAEAVEIDFAPFREAASLLYGGPWVAERLAALDDSLARFGDRFDPTVRKIVEGGRAFTAADGFRASHALAELKRRAEAEWRKMDALFFLPPQRFIVWKP